TVAEIQHQLAQLMQNVDVLGPLPRNVAGQPAYKVEVSPKHSGGLLGNIQLAWDAAHGIPLGIAIYSVNSSKPVLELKATDISYGAIPKSDFNVSPPAGAKVVKVSSPAGSGGKAVRSHARGKAHAEVTGPAAVQSHLPFALAAPSTLVGLPRQSVSLL